jgi:hypothetical protein
MPSSENRHEPARGALVTARQHEVFRILVEEGFTEGSNGNQDSAPEGMAIILDGVLESDPTEDELLDAMTWGQRRDLWDKLRPIARRLLAAR